MSSNYSPWDQSALSLDIKYLMSIPNLTADSVFGVGSPMSPMASVSPAAESPFRVSPTEEMYQSPTQSHPPIPSIPVSSSMPTKPSATPPLMTALPSRLSDGLQIRLNPLVMKPNLNHSLALSTAFKK